MPSSFGVISPHSLCGFLPSALPGLNAWGESLLALVQQTQSSHLCQWVMLGSSLDRFVRDNQLQEDLRAFVESLDIEIIEDTDPAVQAALIEVGQPGDLLDALYAGRCQVPILAPLPQALAQAVAQIERDYNITVQVWDQAMLAEQLGLIDAEAANADGVPMQAAPTAQAPARLILEPNVLTALLPWLLVQMLFLAQQTDFSTAELEQLTGEPELMAAAELIEAAWALIDQPLVAAAAAASSVAPLPEQEAALAGSLSQPIMADQSLTLELAGLPSDLAWNAVELISFNASVNDRQLPAEAISLIEQAGSQTDSTQTDSTQTNSTSSIASTDITLENSANSDGEPENLDIPPFSTVDDNTDQGVPEDNSTGNGVTGNDSTGNGSNPSVAIAIPIPFDINLAQLVASIVDQLGVEIISEPVNTPITQPITQPESESVGVDNPMPEPVHQIPGLVDSTDGVIDHNEIEHNEIGHNEIKHNEIEHNEIAENRTDEQEIQAPSPSDTLSATPIANLPESSGPVPELSNPPIFQLEDGAGRNQVIEISAEEQQVIITNFGGAGEGTNPSQAIIAQADTLVFIGGNLSAQTMLLTQIGADLRIQFEQSDLEVILKDFQLKNLDNFLHPDASVDLANILFSNQPQRPDPQDSFDVFNADSQLHQVFNPGTTTFLNDLDNHITGFENSDDVINGQGGNDKLLGLSGNDILRGGFGDDLLAGGTGNNRLVGNAGSDIFVLSAQGFSQIDDFDPTTDRIGLPNNIRLEQLQIIQGAGASANDSWIRLNGVDLMRLQGLSAKQLTPDHFVSIADSSSW